MMWTYTIALLVSLGGLAILDWRYRLAFWYDTRRAALTVVGGTLVFIAWDLAGIGLGIFNHGSSTFALPFELLPEFPLEEILFLILLCYSTLILFRGAQKLCSRT